MRCERIQSLLSAYVDGELSRRSAAVVSAHVANCAGCAAEWRAVEQVVATLRTLPEEEPPADLRGAILVALNSAQPTLWHRLGAFTQPLRTRPAFALGAVAVGALGLALTTVPLQRGVTPSRQLAHVSYDLRTSPVLYRDPTPIKKIPPVAVAAPATQDVDAADPTDLAPAAPQQARPVAVEINHPTVRLLASAPRAVSRRSRATAGGASSGTVGTRRAASAPVPTFDPLAPVLEPTGSPMAPPMANVVVVDAPPVPAQPETTQVASGLSGSEMTDASRADDDLSALRERLAHVRVQLPVPKIEVASPSAPRRKRPTSIPILRSEF